MNTDNLEKYPKTKELLDRMEAISMLPYRYDKEKITNCVNRIWDLVEQKHPNKIVFCEDIFDERFASASAIAIASARAIASAIASASASASAIASASASARAIASAIARASASDYDFDYLLYEIYLKETKQNFSQKYIDIMGITMEAKEAGLGYLIDDNENNLYIAPNPIVRMVNDNFHSDTSPAIEYTTEKFYFLHNVNFPKKLWEKVVSHQMPFEDILATKNIDQRAQAMRYGDIDAFLKHAKAELLDSSKRNTLYRIPQKPPEVFTEDAYFLRYVCPSTGRVYMSGIPKEIGEKRSADDAMAWKHNFTLSEYRQLVAES